MTRMTLAEARAHFGFSDDVSEAAVRGAALADEIEIVEDGGGDALANSVRDLAAIGTRIADAVAADGNDANAASADLATRAASVLHDAAAIGIQTPTLVTATRNVRVYDRFDSLGYGLEPDGSNPGKERYDANMRASLEMAGMIFGGTQNNRVARQTAVEMPEDFKRAWQHHLFEDESRTPQVANSEGYPTRAMDSAESGFGLDLIGVEYVGQLWEAARQNDSIVGAIREIPMAAPTTTIPIDGDLPEMLFVGESTSASAAAYTTSKTGSGSVDLTAKKFTIQQVWSGELNEDSIIAYTPFLRAKLNMSHALYLGSSYYNGDATTAGTGNINKDDGAPGSTKHYLAYDGIRHEFLVDATGQGKNMAAELDPIEITRARGKLNGGDDDVDNLIKNINWGTSAANLRAVMDWDTYMAMIELDVVKTVDQYGPAATVLSGELARTPGGIPIISPGYASKTDTDGKAVDTESSNTKGQITVFAPAAWIAGRRRDVQLFFDRIQRTDQFLFELYTRRAFQQFGTNGAAGIYNITV